MKKPIHNVSLQDLLCVVQSGSGTFNSRGERIATLTAVIEWNELITDDQAEAEIIRRFKALERKIRRPKGGPRPCQP